MKPKDYVVVTVICPRCRTDQKIHIATGTGAQRSGERISCLNCDNRFEVSVSYRIVDGPFPV